MNAGVLLIGWSGSKWVGAVFVIPVIFALAALSYSGRERAPVYGLLGGIAGARAAAGVGSRVRRWPQGGHS